MVSMKTILTASATLMMTFLLVACTTEIGSEEWCVEMKAKDKGDWTANEAGEFAKNCML